MNDMRLTAQQLAARGRFGDSMLLHVSPAEVAGIASLIPGGLTTNPETGLPEAFFFLPFLASLFGAAAPAATAAAAAAPAIASTVGTAAAGAGSAAAAGLGSLGTSLASLPSTLAHGIGSMFGASAPAAAAVDPIVTGATTAAAAPAVALPAVAPVPLPAAVGAQTLPATTTALPTLKSSLTSVLGNPAGQSYAGTGVASTGPAAATSSPASAALHVIHPPNPTVGVAATNTDTVKNIGSGAFDFIKKNPMIALSGISALGNMLKGSGKSKKGKDRDPNSLPTYDSSSGAAVFPTSGDNYSPGHSSEWNYFPHYNYTPHYANGGIVALAGGGPVDPQAQQPQDQTFPLNGVPGTDEAPALEDMPSSGFPTSQIGAPSEPAPEQGEAEAPTANDHELITQTVEALQGKSDNPRPVILAFIQTFGEPALQDLATRVKSMGGKGPSDGQSDSVPAMIDGKQPAALSQGEFVVPADAVSHLGNGSTDAGAQHLQGMVDNVRQSRTGSPQPPPRLNGGGLVSLVQ